MKKQFIFILLTAIVFCSCESNAISQGRTAYKEYFNNILDDPESLIIYKEEIIAQDETGTTFVLDTEAKNRLGEIVRDTYTIRTIGTRIVDMKENNTRRLLQEVLKEKINFTYRYKLTPMVGFNPKEYIRKEYFLSDSCIIVKSKQNLPEVIEAAKKRNLEKLHQHHGTILPRGIKVKIIGAKDDAFEVKYNDTLTGYIEQSAIF